METIKVGMADFKATNKPRILVTFGLGSCVGIALYDKTTKVSGLAHIMLPSSKDIKNNSNKAKFADTGIDSLIDEMIKLGARKSSIIAKLAGGAQMFSFSSQNDILRIGERNAIASKEKLKHHKIRIVSEDVGGNFGRTIELNSETGKLFIKTIGHGTKTV